MVTLNNTPSDYKMKIRILAVGKIKEDYLLAAIKEYAKRLAAFTVIEIIELAEAKITKENKAEINDAVNEESARILEKLAKKDYNILLDIDGKNLDSISFAKSFLEQLKNHSTFTFIIGGSNGVNEQVKQSVNLRWSFSKLTFPHQLMRVMVLEQIYRAFKINSNQTYHK